jgi:ferric-dicitrate binding protein FerR (iron transport regulator)
MATADHDSVNELIAKHLAGETTSDEESRLFAWLESNEANRQHFASVRKAFELATRHLEVPPSDALDIDVQQEWERFQASVGSEQKSRQIAPARLWMRVAATIALIAIAAIVIDYFSGNDATVYQTAETTQTVSLPDGSTVTLNRYSQLTFSEDFGDASRTLNLQGEAFFDVRPDALKPFVIHAQNARVQVVGTTFSVNAYDSLETVEVVVQTGVVSLQPASGRGKKADVLPGEKGVIRRSDERMSIMLNEDVNFLSWNTRHIVFVDAPLTAVFRTLEKTYDARISLSADVPPSCIVTVTFDGQSLESVMRVLANTLNLKYTINGNKVEITEAGC